MFNRNQKLLIYSLVFVIPFFLLISKPPILDPLKSQVVQSSSLPLQIISFPFQELKKLLFYHWTFNQYQRLKKENETLKARLTGMEEVLIDNKRYERLLDFKRNLIFSSVAANVIGRDPSNWSSAMIIDKGTKEGIEPGMAVVDPLGVVGKVAEVTQKTGKVVLLNDPSFSVAGLVQRSREGGLISGTLQGLCRMRYLSPEADIVVGDTVITSRLSSSFPEGLLIGTVIAVEPSKTSPGIECLLQPATSASQFEEVLIIKKGSSEFVVHKMSGFRAP